MGEGVRVECAVGVDYACVNERERCGVGCVWKCSLCSGKRREERSERNACELLRKRNFAIFGGVTQKKKEKKKHVPCPAPALVLLQARVTLDETTHKQKW